MKRLYFARHGEGTNNIRGVWESDSPAPLTRKGRRQARKSGRKARKQGFKFDAIISSPTTRAKQTAEIIARKTGFPVDKIVFNSLFVERYYGDLEGQVLDLGMNFRNMDNIPNIETLKAMHQRAKKAHDYLLSLPGDDILVVSHSGFGRAIRRIIDKKPHTHEHIEFTSLPHAEVVIWVDDES